MTSGYIPASGEPGPDKILAALEEAVQEEPGSRSARPKRFPATSPTEAISKKGPPLPS
jgi:hypothetical protein